MSKFLEISCWIGCDQEGVCKYDGKAFTYYTPERQFAFLLRQKEAYINLMATDLIDSFNIYIHNQKMKTMTFLFFSLTMLFTSCTQTVKQHPVEKSSSSADQMKGDTVQELANNIMVIYQDKKDNYWFGSWEDGLYKYDGKTILHYTTKNGLPDNRIEEIKEDNAGNVYFNTVNGIMKFDGNNFHVLKVSDSDHHWKLEPDDLWFKDGWNSENIYRFDGSILYKLPIPKTRSGEEYRIKYPSLSPYTVYTIYKDRKGYIWFGTATLGVCRYNGKSFDWISEPDVTEMHDGPANGVRSIIEDKDGFFWFNSEYRYNVFEIAEDKGKPFYERQLSVGSLDGIRNGDLNEYLSIAKDNENNLWIATYLSGVWKYDGNKVKHFAVQENGKDIKLFYIYKDSKGDLWLGTHENGVWKLNGETFIRFTP